MTSLLPPLTGNGCFCIFHSWLLPTSTCSHFWSYYNWLNVITIDFKSCWKNALKKHVFTIILFYFFISDDLSFFNTVQKNFKTFQKKCFNSQDGWAETSYPGISAEGYWQKHEMQVGLKKICWKNNIVFQRIVTYHHWKLNRCIFQISLKYNKSFWKYSLYWYYAILIFTSTYVTPPTKLPPPHKNKNYGPPPPAKTFLTFLPLPQAGGGGGGWMPWLKDR